MINYEIASILQNASNSNTNTSVASLLNALFESPNQASYNDNLHQLMPNNNANSANYALLNSAINLVEKRTSSAINGYAVSGISTGEIYANTAMWLGGFGNFGEQRTIELNEGYRLQAGGGFLGIEQMCSDCDVVGLALGITNARVRELSNSGFVTTIWGYSALLYGADLFAGNKLLEWSLFGGINKQNGSRSINISSQNFNTAFDYHTWQASARVNIGRHINISKGLRLTPLNTIQYTFLHQPAFNEYGSIAALHVAPNQNQSILTVGAGIRVSSPCNDVWMSGSRELRAIVTYDVIAPRQTVTSNFLFNSQTFVISNPQQRLAFRAGADYAVNLCCDQLVLQLRADYEIRNEYNDASIGAELRFLF